MGDNIYLGDRAGCRTPMQWTGDRNAGFSTADPSKLFLPVITDPGQSFQGLNVEAMERSSSSFLNWIKDVLAVRKLQPVFGRGEIEFLRPDNAKVIAYLRMGDGLQTVLVVNNLSRHSQYVELDLRRYDGWTPVDMFGEIIFPSIGELSYLVTLGPYGFYWFRLVPPGGDLPDSPAIDEANQSPDQ
jgi:maltose alpha-D-glucosyltransferase/alpha-amylase